MARPLATTTSSTVGFTPRQMNKAIRSQQSTELAIYQHALAARFRSDTDRLDSQAAGDALRAALDEELSLLDWGLGRAGASQAKTELVARKVEMLSQINNSRITRRFNR